MKNMIKFMSCLVCFLAISPGILFAQDAAIPLPGDDSIPLPGADADMPEASVLPVPDDWTSSLDMRGYVENTTTLEYLKDKRDHLLLNAGRVRLNLEGEPDAALDVGIGLVGTFNTGATDVNLAEYLPDDLRKQILPEAEDFFRYQLEQDELFVQEAFGTWYAEHFRLRVGRHKFYTGTGYAYNPIDLFNVKDPLDPTYESDGLDALLLTLNLPRQTELQGLLRYNDRLETSDYLARIKTFAHGWDVALQYTHAVRERVDWEALNTQEALAALAQGAQLATFTREFRWHLIAAEFYGELWEWGVYGEGGYVLIDAPHEVGTLDEAAADHERLLLGIDHTFGMQLYVMLEYLRFGQGRSDKSAITLNDRMAYLNGEALSNVRDTFFTGMSYPLTDLLDFSLYAIIGWNDGSALLNPWLVYSIRPGLQFSVSCNLPLGDEHTQNGASGASGFFRLKFNF